MNKTIIEERLAKYYIPKPYYRYLEELLVKALQYIPEGELKEDIEEVITYEND
jgi:hypothetical protein